MINIPMPESPTSIFQRGFSSVNDIINKSRAAALERQKMADMRKVHEAELALRRAAEGRASEAAARASQLFPYQLKAAQNSADPLSELKAMIQYRNQVSGEGGASNMPTNASGNEAGNEYESSIPGIRAANMPEEQSNMPVEEDAPMNAHIKPQALGMQDAQQGHDQSNPILKMIDAAIAKKTGANVQSPQEKQKMELEFFKQKEAIKRGAIGDNIPLTPAIKTKLQGVVTGVDNSLPVIQDLITDFKNLPTGSEILHPAAYAAYTSKANAIIEPLINAFGLNVTDATKEMMHDQVFRKTNEPLEKYRNRLVDLAKEIIRRRDDSFKSLKSGALSAKSNFTKEFFEGLKAETKEIDGKKYQKIDGEWHEVD